MAHSADLMSRAQDDCDALSLAPTEHRDNQYDSNGEEDQMPDLVGFESAADDEEELPISAVSNTGMLSGALAQFHSEDVHTSFSMEFQSRGAPNFHAVTTRHVPHPSFACFCCLESSVGSMVTFSHVWQEDRDAGKYARSSCSAFAKVRANFFVSTCLEWRTQGSIFSA